MKPSRLLVPVDFSEGSRSGLRIGAEIARRFDAETLILHVDMTSAALADAMAGTGAFADVGTGHLDRVRARLRDFVGETLGGDYSAQEFVVEDLFVDEAIVRFAVRRKADCICMAAVGKSGITRLLLGSTAGGVVRRSPVPVLTLRTPRDEQVVFDDFRRVLVATDLGENSGELVAAGAEFARSGGALTLLHVIESPVEYGLYGSPLSLPAESLQAAKEWAETALQRMLDRSAGDTASEPLVMQGRPGERILAAEAELSPDITVVGTHGRHGIEHLMLGSVAERVVHHAAGPVLVVPTRPRAD